MARVRDAWQVEIPLRTLFERPTIAGLAEAIEQARQAGAEPQMPAITRVPRAERRVELSSLSDKT
jgi:hypothetical protein